MEDRLLEVKELRTYFYTRDGEIPAVDGVSFHINKGETVALVGESGSGKSITALSIMKSIPTPPGKIVSGQIIFEGKDILKNSEEEMRKIRGNQISMIYQEPMTSLNPVYTIGRQISETMEVHQGLTKKEGMMKAVELLRLVGISYPEKRVNEYPHQMSGGMRQRVMIAMALSCNPKLLIADEPTTALDVTIQAQILEIMKKLKKQIGMGILMITHDLGVVAEVSERVIVMYGGKIVESANVIDLFKSPMHPYTQGLLDSIPSLTKSQERLNVIKGSVPRPTKLPAGCRFHPRCKFTKKVCTIYEPPLKELRGNRCFSCWIGSEEYGSEEI